jgi:hypothetical protein
VTRRARKREREEQRVEKKSCFRNYEVETVCCERGEKRAPLLE